MWEKTGFVDILPPNKRALPRRPKKNRRLEAWDIKKNYKELSKCGIYKELGHNRKQCPQLPKLTTPSHVVKQILQ